MRRISPLIYRFRKGFLPYRETEGVNLCIDRYHPLERDSFLSHSFSYSPSALCWPVAISISQPTDFPPALPHPAVQAARAIARPAPASRASVFSSNRTRAIPPSSTLLTALKNLSGSKCTY